MKKVNLLSAFALATIGLGIVVPSASADETKTTPGVIGFVEDNGTVTPEDPGDETPDNGTDEDPNEPDDTVNLGDLKFLWIPKEFNFGLQKISLFSGTTFHQKNFPSSENANNNPAEYATSDGEKKHQAVSVYDGRYGVDGWEVTASATAFTDKNDNKKTLAGAVINITPSGTYSHFPNGSNGKIGDSPAFLTKEDNFDITTDSTSTGVVFSGDEDAKTQSDLLWDTESVTITVPKDQQVKNSNFASTVTWTLTAAAIV